jgi:hypothetical protein
MHGPLRVSWNAKKNGIKKGNISQLLTEFGLFTGVNSRDINSKEKRDIVL